MCCTSADFFTMTQSTLSVRAHLPVLSAALAGVVFGIGLALAQMTDPLKVLGFLDLAGAWDASLLFVLGGAVLVAAAGFRFVFRRTAPRFGDRFHLSTRTAIDRPLLIGSTLFGLGWGLAGYCPGPALASLAWGNPEALWFVPAMLAGAGLQRWQARRRLAVGVRPAAQTP
jgi:uncharacterized membrane protein YedE/YeeE